MITMHPHSYAHTLLRILASAGEYPVQSFALLGNERSLKALVHKLESVQHLRFPNGNEYTLRMLSVSGWGEKRTVRLYKNALVLLHELHPDALSGYLNGFYNHHFPGGINHILRHHRVAEVLAMMELSDITYAPYRLPTLERNKRGVNVITDARFYPSRIIKNMDGQEMSKTIFTRVTGLLLSPGGAYAVYNTRTGAMRWMDKGEYKTRLFYGDLCMANSNLEGLDSALLFGSDALAALSTTVNSEARSKRPAPFSSIYTHIHFIPLNPDGTRLLRILSYPNWSQKLLHALFTPEDIEACGGYFGCDALVDGRFIISMLDSDLAKFIRFQNRDTTTSYPYEVICYPWQVAFIRQAVGDEVTIQTLDMGTVEEVIFHE